MNLQFDLIVSTLSLGSFAYKADSLIATGLRTFPLTALGDRLIKWMYTGEAQIIGEREVALTQHLAHQAVAALAEETAYAGILMNSQGGLMMRALRLVTSFVLSITASRSLRHEDPSNQDLIDAGVGLGLAVSREVVHATCSKETYLGYSLLSNALTFALIERMKFAGDATMMNYKAVSALLFRLVCDLSALQGKSVVPPLVHHALFNLSRSLS